MKEIIKFRTYIDTLNAAIAKRRELVADKLKVPPLPGDEEEQKNTTEEAADDTTPKARKIIQPGGLDMEVAKMVLGNM